MDGREKEKKSVLVELRKKENYRRRRGILGEEIIEGCE